MLVAISEKRAKNVGRKMQSAKLAKMGRLNGMRGNQSRNIRKGLPAICSPVRTTLRIKFAPTHAMEPFRQKACFTVAISASNPLVKWRSHGMRLAPDGVRRASGEPNRIRGG
jgi:hypothetical protein